MTACWVDLFFLKPNVTALSYHLFQGIHKVARVLPTNSNIFDIELSTEIGL